MLTESVRSFHVPGGTRHLRLTAQLALDADLAGDPGHLGTERLDSWSTIVLTVFFSSSISPATSTVTFWVRSPLATARRHLRDVPHLGRQVAEQRC